MMKVKLTNKIIVNRQNNYRFIIVHPFANTCIKKGMSSNNTNFRIQGYNYVTYYSKVDPAATKSFKASSTASLPSGSTFGFGGRGCMEKSHHDRRGKRYGRFAINQLLKRCLPSIKNMPMYAIATIPH